MIKFTLYMAVAGFFLWVTKDDIVEAFPSEKKGSAFIVLTGLALFWPGTMFIMILYFIAKKNGDL